MFHDLLTEVSAQKTKADFLVTRDTGFERSFIPINTPEQILDKFEEQGLTFASVDWSSLNLD